MKTLPERVALLIVDDDFLVRKDLRLTFECPPAQWREVEAAPSFDVKVATTGSEARQLLRAAEASGRPYDVTVLDLSLPEDDETPESKSVGLSILAGMAPAACRDPVVISRYSDVTTCQELIRNKASDFIDKHSENFVEQVFRSVVRVLRHAQSRRAQAAWAAYRERRARQWLLVQSCNQVADRMGEVVADALAGVNVCLRELVGLIENQQRLRGRVDGELSQALERLTQAVRRIPRRYAEARVGIGPGPGSVEKVVLEAMAEQVFARLGYGVTRKRLTVELPRGQTAIQTFQEVEALFEEVAFGAIETSQEEGTLRVAVERAAPCFVDLIIDDEAASVNPDDLARTAGASAGAAEAERDAGLGLAQRLAHNVGASIEVRQLPEGRGNRVTLRIPVIHDEEDPVGRG
jgi:FixJ family two-component response regulator